MDSGTVNKQMRILVVEDNPDDAELLDFKLQQLKHDFLLDFADTLQQAFIILGKTPFDLVLLDLSLPDCDGIETYTKVADRVSIRPGESLVKEQPNLSHFSRFLALFLL